MVGFSLLESALVQQNQSLNNTSIPSERVSTAPWENSSANTTINDHGTVFQLFVDQLQQRLSLEKTLFPREKTLPFVSFRNTRTTSTIIS